jgi:hypothetical protein
MEQELLLSLFQKKAKKSIGVRVFLTPKDKANAVRNEITNCEFYVEMKVVFNDDFIAATRTTDVIIRSTA